MSKLFVELGEVVKHGGLGIGDMSRVLLKQFIRNTTDEDMLLKLRLDDKLSDPPAFPDFIASVRKEESRRTERRLRQKKSARSQAASVEQVEEPDPEVIRLQKRVAELEAAAVNKVEVQQPQPEGEVAHLQQRVAMLEQRLAQVNRSVFCYRCGEDGHKATVCNNKPNEGLVQQKVSERRRKNQRLN